MRNFYVHFAPMFVRAKDRDEAADVAFDLSGGLEIDEVEEDFPDEDDDS